jgi:hypothetical protein
MNLVKSGPGSRRVAWAVFENAPPTGYLLGVAKFRCVCGEIISTSGEIPNPAEWHALSDAEFGEFVGSIDAEDIYRRTKIFYRCPKSDHVWAFWDGMARPPHLYTPTPLTHWNEE